MGAFSGLIIGVGASITRESVSVLGKWSLGCFRKQAEPAIRSITPPWPPGSCLDFPGGHLAMVSYHSNRNLTTLPITGFMLSQTTYWGHPFCVTGHRYDPVSVVILGFSCFFLHLPMALLCCGWVFLCGSVVKGEVLTYYTSLAV